MLEGELKLTISSIRAANPWTSYLLGDLWDKETSWRPTSCWGWCLITTCIALWEQPTQGAWYTSHGLFRGHVLIQVHEGFTIQMATLLLGLKLMEIFGQNPCCTASGGRLVLLVLTSAPLWWLWPAVVLISKFPHSSPWAGREGTSCPWGAVGPIQWLPLPWGAANPVPGASPSSCQWRQGRAGTAGKAKATPCSVHCFHSHGQVWFLFGVFHRAPVNAFYCKSWRLNFTTVSLGGDFWRHKCI